MISTSKIFFKTNTKTGAGLCTTKTSSYKCEGIKYVVCEGKFDQACNQISSCWDPSTENSLECKNYDSVYTRACYVICF